jgi:hypothetical protein
VSVNCNFNNRGGNFQFTNVRVNRQNFYPNLAFIRSVKMNKQLIKFSAIIGCIVTFAVTNNAKSVSRSECKIPFDFIVKDQTFTAGKYTIEQLNPANSDFLILKKVGGTEKTIFLIQSASTDESQKQTHLIFSRSSESYVLREIWTFGEKYGQFYDAERHSQKSEKLSVTDSDKPDNRMIPTN